MQKNAKKCIKSEALGASVARIWKIMNKIHVKSSEHGGACNEFYVKKLIFSKEIEKNWKKKIEKNWKKCIKSELLGASDMTWTCPGYVQDMPRTWQDTWGLIWVFKNSKSDQNPPRYRHFCTANCRTKVSNKQSFCY
jgi:hypothetical protein